VTPARSLVARVFPYQLLTAYANCDPQVPRIVRDALQDAMELAVANVPVIEARSSFARTFRDR